MFGCVVAERLLQTLNLEQINGTRFILDQRCALRGVSTMSVFGLGTGKCHFLSLQVAERWDRVIPRRIWRDRSFPLARKRIPIIREVSPPSPTGSPLYHSLIYFCAGFQTRNHPQIFVSVAHTRRIPQLLHSAFTSFSNSFQLNATNDERYSCPGLPHRSNRADTRTGRFITLLEPCRRHPRKARP